MKQIIQFIAMSLLVLGLSACDSEKKDTPIKNELGISKDFTNSGCRNNEMRSFKTMREVPIERLELKAIKDGYLEVAHLNLEDYCERDDSYSITTSVEGNKLTVVEEAKNAPQPKCYCFYDLGVKLGGFELGKSYTLVFKREKWVFATLSFVYTSDFQETLLIEDPRIN